MTAVAAQFTDSLAAQFFVLAVSSTLMMVLFRKYVHTKKESPQQSTNIDSMVGKEAVVIEDIDNQKEKGYVKLYGDEWRAINLENTTVAKGERVVIEKIDGNKVLIRPKSLERSEAE